MPHTRALIAFVATLALAGPALAQAVPASTAMAPQLRRVRFDATGSVCSAEPCRVLSAKALDADEAVRTFALDVAGLSRVTIQVDLTRDAATDLQLTCSVSLNRGASYAQIHSTKVVAGVGTLSPYADVRAVDASVSVPFEFDVRTYDRLRCVVSGTSGGAGDLVDIYAIGAVGQ